MRPSHPSTARAWLAGASVMLAGCLTDTLVVPLPLDTDTGTDTTTPTSAGTGAPGNPTSGLDSNSGSGQVLSLDDDGSTSEVEPCDGVVCPPDEVCIAGVCFECPPPTCERDCGGGESCQCPPGDPCCELGACLADCRLAPVAGSFAACIDATGTSSDAPCEGAMCVADGVSDPTAGICMPSGCELACQCPAAPPTGNAEVVCEEVTGDGLADCWLDCESGQACPDGMFCFGGFICLFPVPPAPPSGAYGDCADNPASTCLPAEDACLVSADGTASACSQTGCVDALGCPSAPPSGSAPVACGDLGAGNTCYLDCGAGQTCPAGAVCSAAGMGMACLWPDDGLLLDERFDLGALRAGWMVYDVDGNTPDASVSFVSEAWVVTDQSEPGANFAAYSTSWYQPAGQADDWLITPQIVLGPASTLSWRAWALDPMFPDGYEVRISTATTALVDFGANPPLFELEEEASVPTPHAVDLAAAGYASQAVYLAFRNHSNDDYVLVLDDVQVTE